MWLTTHKDLLSAIGSICTVIGVISALLFNAYTVKRNTKTLQLTNLFQITQFHRSIWSITLDHPELNRVLDESLVYETLEISKDERLFANFLILHLNLSYQAIKTKSIINADGIEQDIKEFFSLPIPRKVWEETKAFQNSDFIDYVEKFLI